MLAKHRNLLVLGLLGFSVLVFLGTAYIGLNKLSSKSQNLVSLKLKSKTLDDQLASLAAAKKQVQKYSYFNTVAASVIPNDKDQAQTVLDIFQMAGSSGIALQAINFPSSSLGATTSTIGSSTPSTTKSSTISQAKPVSGISGLYSLQLIITPQTGATVPATRQATYAKFLDFLNRIEHDRRTAQVTQISVQPLSGTPYVNFSLTVNIFIKP